MGQRDERAGSRRLDTSVRRGGRLARTARRRAPGVLLGPIRAECLIRADFVQARLDTHIWPDLLDEWEEALVRLGAGEGAGWAQGGRGLRLYFHPSDSGRLSLSVHDPDRLTVALGLEPPPQWIEEHEIRLRRMREVWES
ncbi:DUF5959 family protein [Streptomyces nigra]|uniref:DUF5959 family protein n=1 Tax=Streptomyces nigra TaxID=1827580 RepID=UPI003695A270